MIPPTRISFRLYEALETTKVVGKRKVVADGVFKTASIATIQTEEALRQVKRDFMTWVGLPAYHVESAVPPLHIKPLGSGILGARHVLQYLAKITRVQYQVDFFETAHVGACELQRFEERLIRMLVYRVAFRPVP